MRCLPLIALVIASIGFAGPALAAPPIIATTPVFGKIIAYTLPEGFGGAFADSNDSFYIQEAVPAGETVNVWSQMITMTGNKGAAAGTEKPLAAAANSMLEGYRKACPQTLAAEQLGTSTIDGREAFTVFLGCGEVDTAQGKVSETAVMTFIVADDDVYTLQWAEHKAAQMSAPAYNADVWSARIAQFNPIRVCDRVEGEAAPYPSCNIGK